MFDEPTTGPALRRHRQADALVPQAARRRPLADRHRAQPRRDPRRRLADRPRPRRRRGRRRARRRRHARGRASRHADLAHRQGAAPTTTARSASTAPRSRKARRCSTLVKPARAQRAAVDENDPHRQRARAQPEVARRRDPARQVQRHHRRLGLGQDDARVRHPVQRRPAALSRIAERLCAQHRAAGRPARGRRGLRHPADGRDRAAPVARRAQEHGRDDDRGLALPAPALRQARPAALRRRTARRSRPQSAESIAAQLLRDHTRRARRPARAAGRRAQGRLHRPREVGEGARPHPPARRRRVHQGRPVAAPRPLQGAHARAAGRRPRRQRRQRSASCARCSPRRSTSARA